MRVITGTAVLGIMLMAACDSPTDHEDGVAYDMIQVASQTLPIEIGQTDGCVDSLYAASVLLEADHDAYVFTGAIRNCGGARTQLRKTREGSYQQSGNELSFTWVLDGDPIITYATELAVLEGNTLTFRQRVYSEEDPDGTTFYDYAVYQRR
jgi:hypothetical protein